MYCDKVKFEVFEKNILCRSLAGVSLGMIILIDRCRVVLTERTDTYAAVSSLYWIAVWLQSSKFIMSIVYHESCLLLRTAGVKEGHSLFLCHLLFVVTVKSTNRFQWNFTVKHISQNLEQRIILHSHLRSYTISSRFSEILF